MPDFSTMKIIVIVMIYNRFENLKRWIDCWKKCQQLQAQLVILHNHDAGTDYSEYENYCLDHNVKYVPRLNIGMDMGAFQDVCLNRLKGLDNNWDILFWVTDDVIPMRKDFLPCFVESLLQPNIGISCMQISDLIATHVRTTGFCIKKEIANQLKFPVDPIETKDHCYEFEHRGNTLMKQIEAMGLKAVMPFSLDKSAVWDMNITSFNRWKEHYLEFSGKEQRTNKITFICPIFNTFPEIVSSLICQTHINWELLLIHETKNQTKLTELLRAISDKRITYIETSERVGFRGHPIIKWAVEQIRDNKLAIGTEFIVITNPDNHHVPIYCEELLEELLKHPDAVASYCSQMVHNLANYGIINLQLKRGFIDSAAVMVRKEVACDIGWFSNDHSADWFYFDAIIKKYGKEKFLRTDGCLLVRNGELPGKKDVFIGSYTNVVKKYCDKQFYENLHRLSKGNEVHIVDNSIGLDYFNDINSICKEYDNFYFKHIEVPVEPKESVFQRRVIESINYLRQLFLDSKCEYFITIESDVMPPFNIIESFKETIKNLPENWGMLGALYHGQDGGKGFHDLGREVKGLYQTKQTLCGCTIYNRKLIEKYPFRWDKNDLRHFHDVYIYQDANKEFTFWDNRDINCLHIPSNAIRDKDIR